MEELSSQTNTPTICYVGWYDPAYSRNSILLDGLRENGVVVVECRTEETGFAKYVDLVRRLIKLRHSYDVLMAGFPAQHVVLLARLFTSKPIVFDALFSLYDAEVIDRKSTSRWSIRGCYYWLLDWMSCRWADLIIVDTEQHRDYFVSAFGADEHRCAVVPVGVRSLYHPIEDSSAEVPFLVHFHGTNIPLQGIPTIIEAARLLEQQQVSFQLIGTSLSKHYCAGAPSNIVFRDSVSPEELNMRMGQASVCLGIFGDTPKASRVVPNKVFEAWACRRAVITADTPAMSTIMSGRTAALVCRAHDPRALADAIVALRDNNDLRERIATTGYELVTEFFGSQRLGTQLLEIIRALVVH